MEQSGWDQDQWEKANRRRGGCARIFLAVGLLLLGAVIGVAIFSYSDITFSWDQDLPFSQNAQEAPATPSRPNVPEEQPPVRIAPEPYKPEIHGPSVMTSDTVKDIVALCGDSVVSITTETTRTSQSSPFFNDPFFRDFFGSPQQPRIQQGMGSGFLFRQDGYILTNNHVIDGADKISVYMYDKENPYEAVVVGRAPELDLAVIKIEGEGFPYLLIGDSDQVSVGDWVVAIGNPYGLDHTVTVGVISAMGRPLTIEGTLYQDLLQTDAAINPGNSGGPMLNLRGEVIGINTAINASAQGIGFAIPSRTVLDVLDDLEAGVERARPWIGITMQPLSSDMRQYLGVEDVEGGVIVNSVIEGAPAEKAGVRKGDVLIEIDGQVVTDMVQVQGVVARCRVGDTIKILVYRDGGEIEFMVELEERPEQ